MMTAMELPLFTRTDCAEADVTHADPEFLQRMCEIPTASTCRDIYDVNATKNVETWTATLSSCTLHDSDFLREPSLIDLFIKYNILSRYNALIT
jgi:hypothetical protein